MRLKRKPSFYARVALALLLATGIGAVVIFAPGFIVKLVVVLGFAAACVGLSLLLAYAVGAFDE